MADASKPKGLLVGKAETARYKGLQLAASTPSDLSKKGAIGSQVSSQELSKDSLATSEPPITDESPIVEGMGFTGKPENHDDRPPRLKKWERALVVGLVGAILLTAGAGVILSSDAAQAAPRGNTIVVDTNAEYDIFHCTLKAAINAANTDQAVDGCIAGSPGADTIVLPAGIYLLTDPNNIDANADATALPVIQSPITVTGADINATTLQVPDNVTNLRFFRNINQLTLNNLTLKGGKVKRDGGAINSGLMEIMC